MANYNPSTFTPTLVQAPTAMSGGGVASLAQGDVRPHHGVIGLVLISALVLFLLDKAGFRFAVTVGRR